MLVTVALSIRLLEDIWKVKILVVGWCEGRTSGSESRGNSRITPLFSRVFGDFLIYPVFVAFNH